MTDSPDQKWSTGANKWEWSAEEIKRVGYRVVDLIAHHLTTLPERPVFQPFDPDLAKEYLANSAPPESGESADEILSTFAEQIEPFPFGNGHPRFHGWVNSPPAVMGIFADALAAAMNPSCAGGNHAAIYVERQVIGWFKRIVGFPDSSMGLLVSGGSMASLTALAVARHQKCGFDIHVLPSKKWSRWSSTKPPRATVAVKSHRVDGHWQQQYPPDRPRSQSA